MKEQDIWAYSTGATHSLSCGTTDRDCNEAKYLQEALDLLDSFHRRDTHRGGPEVLNLSWLESGRCCVRKTRRS